MATPTNTYVETSTSRLPVPDPTALTTAALLREINALKELFDMRFTGMEHTIQTMQSSLDQRGIAIKTELNTLDKLFDEKLLRIQTQISERDVQTDKASRDVKSAVDAAFAAAKEAVGEQNKSNALSISKSEAAFVKQVDAIVEIVKNNTKTTDDKISDIKDRLLMIEGRSTGHGETWGYVAGAIASMWAIAATIGLIVEFTTRHP